MIRPASAQSPAALITRAIPASGEPLPAVGLGTAEVFDTDDAATRQSACAVIQALVDNGGTLIDTASTYGDVEQVIGDVTAPAGLRDKLFIATKLEAPDGDELKRSLQRLRTTKVDVLQLHNVSDPQQSLAAFKQWKAQGLCRYIGITSTYRGAFPAVEAVLAREKPDFVQIDYSIDDREAEKRILPLAADKGAAVLTAAPFWPRALIPRRARQGNSRLGFRIRRELGAIFSQISAWRPAGDRGDPRQRQWRPHGRQSRRHARCASDRRRAAANGAVHWGALA